MFSRRVFNKGDWVVYRKSKQSVRPGPRARDVYASPHGEQYRYFVDKFWAVVETRDDGTVVLETRRGKMVLIEADDPNLHYPTWWERIRHRSRFPHASLSDRPDCM
jgi:hypothetical protein